jgi:hypothetical protein
MEEQNLRNRRRQEQSKSVLKAKLALFERQHDLDELIYKRTRDAILKQIKEATEE